MKTKTKKVMKGYLIDPYAKTVTEIEYNGSIDEIYKLGGYDCFACVQVARNGDTIYVDDEGLLKITPDTKFFRFETYPQPLAGKGVMLGLNARNGETVSVRMSIEDVRKQITWMDLNEVRTYAATHDV